MLLKTLKSKIHRATVTTSDLHYEGSISIDAALIQAAGLLPYEAVQIWNITNGERFETYIIPAAEGSGEIGLNGAAARRVQVGDLIIVTAFAWMDEDEARGHAPTVVFVDAGNRLASIAKTSGSAPGSTPAPASAHKPVRL
jgi:aspartate 1-decarboxylase